MKIIYLLIFCLLAGCSGRQSKDEYLPLPDSANFYESFFNADSSNVYRNCERGAILFYFTLDEKGFIQRVEYSNKANELLASRFVKLLTSFNGKFVNRGRSETVYLLPYIYNFQVGCGEILNEDSTVRNTSRDQIIGNLSDLFIEKYHQVVVMPPIRESTLE